MKIFLLKDGEKGVYYLVPGLNKEKAAELASSCKPGTYTCHGESAEFSENNLMPIGFFSTRSGNCCLAEADIYLHGLHA